MSIIREIKVFFFWFLVLLIKEFSNRFRRRFEDYFSRGEIKSNRIDNFSSCQEERDRKGEEKNYVFRKVRKFSMVKERGWL